MNRQPVELLFSLVVQEPIVGLDEAEQQIRNRAWNILYPSEGVAHNPNAAFYKFAAANDLGLPTTNEARLVLGMTTYAFQGFVSGIVWTIEGQWNNLTAMSWF